MADTVITSAALQQGRIVLNELATLANQIDREAYFTHGDFFGKGVDPERASLEVDRLRRAICKMGWLADLASEKIGGDIARGAADAWLLSPSYHDAAEAAPDPTRLGPPVTNLHSDSHRSAQRSHLRVVWSAPEAGASA